MEYRLLGKTGLRLSAFGFGSWATFGARADEHATLACLKYAYDQGVNYFDTADCYQDGKGEILLGQSLKKLGLRRSSYCVSTKFFFGRCEGVLEKETLNKKYIISSLDQSLKNMDMDFVDMALCHRHDPNTATEDVVETMDYVVRSGRALYWGTSEWSASQLVDAYRIASARGLIPPKLEQPEYNLLRRYKVEHMLKPVIENDKIGLVTWSPLSSGVLTGKYLTQDFSQGRAGGEEFDWLRERIEDPKVCEKVMMFKVIAEKLGISMARLSVAWCLMNKDVTSVLLGATSEKQLAEIMKAADDVALLTDDVMREIDGVAGLICC